VAAACGFLTLAKKITVGAYTAFSGKQDELKNFLAPRSIALLKLYKLVLLHLFAKLGGTKVNVLRDSHKPFLSPNRQFGGKTLLAGLRLKNLVKFTFKV
jgi:hypothetical protein